MVTRHRGKLTADRRSILDRLVLWTALALILAIVGFVSFYLADRPRAGNPSTLGQDTARVEEAVRADPNDFGARVALAGLYYADRRYRESVEQYRAALTLKKDNVPALVSLGRALVAAHDPDGAIESLQKVIDAAKGADVAGDLVEAAYYYLGRAYMDKGQADQAISQLEHAVSISRSDSDAWYLLGDAYLQQGDLDQAIRSLTQAVLFVPDYAEAYDKLVVAYDRKGAAAEGHYARGMAAFARKRYSDAAKELQATLQASPDLVVAQVGLGLVYESQGAHAQAAAAYQQALRLEPSNFNARAGLARLGRPLPAEPTTAPTVTP